MDTYRVDNIKADEYNTLGWRLHKKLSSNYEDSNAYKNILRVIKQHKLYIKSIKNGDTILSESKYREVTSMEIVLVTKVQESCSGNTSST